MSAQRKLISVLRPVTRSVSRQVTPLRPTAWARSITTTSILHRPAAEKIPESKQEDKTVPSEQITEEAKAAEPDAEEQVEEVSTLSGGKRAKLISRWRRKAWTLSPPRLKEW